MKKISLLVVQGFLWEAGTHDYFFLLSLLIAVKVRFPVTPVYAKRKENCAFLSPLLEIWKVLGGTNRLNSTIISVLVYHNHHSYYKLVLSAREKVNLLYDWLFRYYQRIYNECICCINKQHRQPPFNTFPNLNLSILIILDQPLSNERQIRLV